MADLKNKALSAIDTLKKAGADMSQVNMSESVTNEMTLAGNEFTLYRSLFNESVAVVVYKDQKKGLYTTNKIDDASIDASIKAAIEAAEASQPDEAYDIAPFQGEFEETEGPLEPDEELLFKRVKELKEQAGERYPKVNVFQIIAKYTKRKSVYVDSNNTVAVKEVGYYSFTIEFNGMDGERTSSLDYTGFTMIDLSKPLLECADVAVKFANAEKQLDAVPSEGKFTGVLLLDPGMVSQTMYSVMSMAGGTNILEKTSVYLDKLDQKIADERLTVRYECHDPRIIACALVTNEGFKAESYNFIENGVLKQFMIDYYIEKKTGFKHAPTSDGGLVINSGNKPLAEIIKGIKKGLLCGGFSGGEPGANGEFSGVAKNSFLIEDGKITKAVTETMISGNFADMINNLVDISEETVLDGASMLPYIAFDGITISGK